MSRISLFRVNLFRCLVIKLKNVTSLFGSPRKPKTDSETLNMYCIHVFITCYCTVHNKYCKYTVHAFKSANKVISIDEKSCTQREQVVISRLEDVHLSITEAHQ